MNLTAPATDPAGYTFSQWTVNGTAQTAGLKSITFAMPAAAIAVAQYTPVTYTLSRAVHAGDRSEHQFELRLRRDDELHRGRHRVRHERGPRGPGYGFGRGQLRAVGGERPGLWVGQYGRLVHGDRGTTAMAQYTGDTNVSTLLVLSAPPTGLSIGSSTGDGGNDRLQRAGYSAGTTVNLSAPAADPSGYVFSEWTVNGAALTAAQKSVTFSAATNVVLDQRWNRRLAVQLPRSHRCRQPRQCLCGQPVQQPHPEFHLRRRFRHPVGRLWQRQRAILIPFRRRYRQRRQCLCDRL